MHDPSRYIETLYVERQCRDLAYAREIIERSGLSVVEVEDGFAPQLEGAYPDNLTRGKKHLLLCRNRGRFFKPCPGTKEYQCCGYHVLNIGMNCPMDCVYCILQAYLNNPWLSFFVNIDALFRELAEELDAHPEKLYRIGTGEFTDSLALDRITGLSTRLIDFFKDRNNAILELKTKSDVVSNVLETAHGGRTIISWSLNSPEIAGREELRTAGLDRRLSAALKCVEKGYHLGFHFDPIIYHPGWQEGYKEIITRLFARIPADRIVWISLGALRFIPQLKTIATERFPSSRFFYQEFVEGLDAKSRYFIDRRIEMYKLIVEELQKHTAHQTCLYFCMESDAVWKEVFGFIPADRDGLPAMLDKAARVFMGA